MITHATNFRWLAPALLCAALAGCSSDSQAPRPPASIEAVSTTTYAATAGAIVSPSPAIRVKDDGGNAVSGAQVTFAVTQGGGSVTGATSSSDQNGIATVGSWTLGAVAGVENILTATVAGLPQASVTFTASAAAGPATNLAITQGNNQTGSGQLPVDPTVKAADAFGNGVAGVSVRFDITIGEGLIYAASPTNNRTLTLTTDGGGLASVHWGLSGLDVTNAMTATATGLAGSPVTFSATGIIDPALLEDVGAGAVRTWANVYEGLNAVGPLTTQARTYSASWNNASMAFYSSVDNASSPPDQWNRNTRAWQNDASVAEFTGVRWLWSGGANQSNSTSLGYRDMMVTAAKVLKVIRKDNAVVRNSSDTKRLETVASLMEGASLMGFALNYDKAFLIDENTDTSAGLSYSNRKALRDAAVAKFTNAASLANANSFITPSSWFNGRIYTSSQIARVASTMAAMTLAYYPRNATENAAVDWVQVATFASSGISTGTPFPFEFVGDGCPGWCPEILMWFNDISVGRVSTRVARLLDPATQSDPWPSIGNPQPNSVDRRLGNGTYGDGSLAGTDRETPPKNAGGGSDFAWSPRDLFLASRGTYHRSNIAHVRYDVGGLQNTGGIIGGFGPAPLIIPAVNDLLWAEALLRSGGSASTAATLINKSRVDRGGLSAAAQGDGVGSDADGPCTSAGTLAKDGTTSCTLMAKLLYENEIELLGLGALPFYEQRRLPLLAAGGRVVQGLLPGTPREMPVPATVLTSRGEPGYTWGGTGPANSTPP